MEKEMLAIARLKSGEGKFEKFMGFMQSDEGMAVRKTIACWKNSSGNSTK